MRRLFVFAAILVLLPLLVIFMFYRVAMGTGLPGRRGGPQDAFRHTYASAMVARYSAPFFVDLVTAVCEDERESIFSKMDVHNNKVGIKVGMSDGRIYDAVMKKIAEGQVDSDEKETITWLAKENWSEGL